MLKLLQTSVSVEEIALFQKGLVMDSTSCMLAVSGLEAEHKRKHIIKCNNITQVSGQAFLPPGHKM